MKRVLLAMMLMMGIFAGCQQEPARVVERLPDPFYVERQHSPTPPTPPPALPTGPVIPRNPNWLPSRGISNRWQCIVVHHTASAVGSLRDVDTWHKQKGWDGCGYHFVVGNGTHSPDGLVEPSARWQDQSTGAHTRLANRVKLGLENYYNEHGIGIVLVGDFERGRPSVRQMDALARLVRFLMASSNIPENRVYVHGTLKSTDCPGRYFSRADLIARVKALQQKGL